MNGQGAGAGWERDMSPGPHRRGARGKVRTGVDPWIGPEAIEPSGRRGPRRPFGGVRAAGRCGSTPVGGSDRMATFGTDGLAVGGDTGGRVLQRVATPDVAAAGCPSGQMAVSRWASNGRSRRRDLKGFPQLGPKSGPAPAGFGRTAQEGVRPVSARMHAKDRVFGT